MSEITVSSETQRIVVAPSGQVTILDPSDSGGVQIISKGAVGPRGFPGPEGPVGPRGPAGESAGYVHPQATASEVWTVFHNLELRPGGISVLDENGDLVLGWSATHASAQILILTFPSAVSGTAYIS